MSLIWKPYPVEHWTGNFPLTRFQLKQYVWVFYNLDLGFRASLLLGFGAQEYLCMYKNTCYCSLMEHLSEEAEKCHLWTYDWTLWGSCLVSRTEHIDQSSSVAWTQCYVTLSPVSQWKFQVATCSDLVRSSKVVPEILILQNLVLLLIIFPYYCVLGLEYWDFMVQQT